MFNEETRKELVQIIAQGVSQALNERNALAPQSVSVNTSEKVEPTKEVETIAEDDDFAEANEGPTPEEVIAQKKSDAAKKAAATRKKNAADKKAKKEAAAAAAKEVETEEVDDLEDDLEEGSDAEMIEAPPMDRVEFMATLKRYASKHPNGEKLGRALASEVLTRDYDVAKFGELEEKYFEAMCKALKEEIKGI